MLRFAFFSLSLGALLLAAHPARGGTLATEPVVLQVNDGIMCILVNAGTKDAKAVSVQILEWDHNGVAAGLGATTPADVAPGGLVQTSDLATDLTPTFAMCRFTFKGSAKNLRATANVSQGGSALLATQAAH
jgi:hypothetical protein